VAVVTVPGYDLVALLQGHLHPDHDGFLADLEMAEAADRAHAVELAGLFLEAADQEHIPQRSQFQRLGEFRWGPVCLLLPCFLRDDAFLGCSHGNSG
jgi:glyoxylase-like metal-dependent hydrolase (beta-lactamase superfamily II)